MGSSGSPTMAHEVTETGQRQMDPLLGGNKPIYTGPTESRVTASGCTGPRPGSHSLSSWLQNCR